MRKAQKNQAEEFVNLLEQAQKEIQKAVEHGKWDIALDLLEQSQEGAIELGGVIEEKEGEDFVTVQLLTDYCELIYQLYEKIRQRVPVNIGKEYKNLRKALIRVENSIRNDIKRTIKAVFLPYKASMWDSLESVWKAADEDPDCQTYVIPIPYYDKNADGSLGEVHYEGDSYPEYVPTVWYEDFDFEKEKPDMIFIHNPYDKYNRVTSVHPFFYAENLKQYTEKLVYVPYFILGEISPDNKIEVDGMQHFCVTPGVIYADEVIVQSETMRQIYINILTEWGGESQRKYWERKILGLGSPKMDRVLRTEVGTEDIPETWKPFIYKTDGAKKKIVLYNTGVSALLQNSDKYIEKLRSVFQIFQEYQKEVVLLWRPHPLLQATISSMRPKLWDQYQKVVEEYQNTQIGIYDNTPELDRAIGLADIYYGDDSSVVHLCRQVGMPILIQNVEVL